MEAMQRELLSLTSERDTPMHPESSPTCFYITGKDNITATEETKNQLLFDQSKHSENADVSDDGYKAEMDNAKTKVTYEGKFKEDMYYQNPQGVKILPSQIDPLAFGDVCMLSECTDQHSLDDTFWPDCWQIITYKVPKFPIIFCVVIIIAIVTFIGFALARKGRLGQ